LLLYDASAIAIVLKRFGEEAVPALSGGATADLAKYEFGNVVWKECALLKRASPQEALRAVSMVPEVLGAMEVVAIEGGDYEEALKVALECGLSFYDASYIQLARRLGAALVTEDEELSRCARGLGLKVLRARDAVR